MSRLADCLHAVRVYNDHDLLSRFAVVRQRAICVSPYTASPCFMQPAVSRVWSPFFETDPDAHWSDHGSKTFLGRRSESMPKALAWASEQYGISEWAPSPFGGGSKIPKAVRDASERVVASARNVAQENEVEAKR